jgi:hypothetical protein
MNKLKMDFKNCYGIQSLQNEFEFDSSKRKVYAIYAPNGLMKTSFSSVFEDLSNGNEPKEERYNRLSTCIVKSDGVNLQKAEIYVLKSEMDISSDSLELTAA